MNPPYGDSARLVGGIIIIGSTFVWIFTVNRGQWKRTPRGRYSLIGAGLLVLTLIVLLLPNLNIPPWKSAQVAMTLLATVLFLTGMGFALAAFRAPIEKR